MITRRAALAAGAGLLGTLACPRKPTNELVIDDVSRLNEMRIKKLVTPRDASDVVAAVRAAASAGDKVIASGARHSQGAQNKLEGAVVIDMRSLSQFFSVDADQKCIRVAAGASWDAVQRALNPHKLAVKVMQSSNVFTVGGSIGSNIHGRDVRDGTIASTVRGLTIVDPAGELRRITPEHELFPFVVGGYGLFGIVLEADLDVVPNTTMTHFAWTMPAEDVPNFFAQKIAGRDTLWIARPSIVAEDLLGDTIVEAWAQTDAPIKGDDEPLGDEENVARDKAIFDASRDSEAGKSIRWKLQRDAALKANEQTLSRNNCMRPPTTPLALLAHTRDADTDVVQEYFVPVARYGQFLEATRRVLRDEHVNLLGCTIRFVKAPTRRVSLSYADEDAFAFMLYTNQKRSVEGRAAATRMTQKLVDAVLDVGGRHYLTYQRWPTRDQVRRTYPGFDAFVAKKRALDPREIFSSGWWTYYA